MGKGNTKTSKAVLLGHVAFYLYIKYLPIAVQCHLRSMFEEEPAHEEELQRAIKALKATKKELTGIQTKYTKEIAPHMNSHSDKFWIDGHEGKEEINMDNILYPAAVYDNRANEGVFGKEFDQ